MVPRKAAKLEKLVKIFLKRPLWPIATKLESAGTRIFLQEVVQESCGWNKICQNLMLTLCIVTPPCFLAKIVQVVQKVIVFFPERGEEIEPWFCRIWISQWLKFFCTTTYLFTISSILRGKWGVKVGPTVQTLGPSLSIKTQILQKNFKAMLLFARILPAIGPCLGE